MMEHKKYLASFARRLSRSLTLKQNGLLDQLLPQVRYDKERLAVALEDFANLRVELGFGGGEHLVARAIEHSNTLFIGCEPYINGVVKVLGKIEALGLKNILIHTNDAREVLEELEPKSIEVMYILFPDPWPKTKQKKRRIVSIETLKMVYSQLKNGGKLVIATDHEDYAKHIMKVINSINLFEYERSIEDINIRPEGWVQTKYEEKAKTDKKYYFLLKKA